MARLEREQFPSPFGVRVLKLARISFIKAGESAFPSPFGVRVLKFALPADEQASKLNVSVPFRGSCSEMSWRESRSRFSSTSRFRPLSGFVF